jgi:hypothetical protein
MWPSVTGLSPVLKAPITSLPCIKAPRPVPNDISFEPDGWISTPLLRRAGRITHH